MESTFLCFDTGVFKPLGGGTVKRFRKVKDRNLDQIKRIRKDIRNFFFFNYDQNNCRTNYSKSYIVDGKVFSLKDLKEEAKKQKGYNEENLKNFLSEMRKRKVQQVVLDRFGKVFEFDPEREEIFITLKR
ncbi:MAG: hypothetical protein QG630_163 [Patescibacteria group bacterium]|nr:hypothetical protein [Patescibacteria group bacterium]